MKVCKNCQENDQEKFSKAWRGLLCIKCHNERQNNKAKKGKERNDKSKLDRKECLKCKLIVTETNTHHFEWDHLDHMEKDYTVGKMSCMSDDLYYVEIAKCDLLCLFCHADRTKEQRLNKTYPVRGSKYKG